MSVVTSIEGKARRDERIEVQESQRQAVLEHVLEHPLGREFIWGLLGECGLFRTSWHPSALIHFNEGRRDVGLKVMNEITTRCPDAYLLMQREAMERAKKTTEIEDENDGR